MDEPSFAMNMSVNYTASINSCMTLRGVYIEPYYFILLAIFEFLRALEYRTVWIQTVAHQVQLRESHHSSVRLHHSHVGKGCVAGHCVLHAGPGLLRSEIYE
jgi:hypothetical protein